ncbi:hypothetical protein C0993_003748 [Termitomyces sp. T159_Od127]|nr:hypothetical protein C0993_003748 [Termitomyces sp. T159_Od127]
MRAVLPTTLRHAVLRRAAPAPARPQPARFASTSTDAAQQKAKDALGSAAHTAGKAWESAAKLLGPAGEKAASLLGAYREPLFYNLAVAREVVKHVYRAEGLAPPSFGAVQAAYQTLWATATNPAHLRQLAGSGGLARVGVYALEAYGIFKIGEMMGRRSVVGYDLH